MPLPSPTVKELVATLRRSTLPTVLVEGQVDMRIFRWVEEHRLGRQTANVLPAGGRDKLLCIYNEGMNSLICRLLLSLIGICGCSQGLRQSTMRSFGQKGIASKMTLYVGAELENLLDSGRNAVHRQLLDAIAEWFVFEVEECLAGRPYEVKLSLQSRSFRLVRRKWTRISVSSRGFRPPSAKDSSTNQKGISASTARESSFSKC